MSAHRKNDHNVSEKCQPHYREIVQMLLHMKCECGQPVAVKHGDKVFCAGCWMDKYGPAKHKRHIT